MANYKSSSNWFSPSHNNPTMRHRNGRFTGKSQQQQQRRDPVGTEAVALEHLKANAKLFQYPEGGFHTKMEYSLLYAMIREPQIFPAEVVLQTIQEEDFSVYLYYECNDPHRKKSLQTVEATSSSANTATTAADHHELLVSYAQLTALLARTGDEWKEESQVPQTLCNCVLKCVIQYAEEHGLDRKTETDELLDPLLKYAQQRGNDAFLTVMLPLYVGYTASILTGNPLPLLASYVATFHTAANSEVAAREANGSKNLQTFLQKSERASDLEQTSLLDEQF